MTKLIAQVCRQIGGTGLAALLSLFVAAHAHAQSKLTVYTALETEQLAPYKTAFEKANPDVEIEWVRDSTGIITARLLAEKANPQADVVWGLAASSLLMLSTRTGMLDALRAEGPGRDQAEVHARQPTPPTWVGMDAWCVGRLLQHRRGARRRSCRSRPPGPT